VIFARRGSQNPDPHLDHKVKLFFAGGSVALLGIALNSKTLVGLALVVLIGGVFLRLFLGRLTTQDEVGPPEEGGHGENGQE
jgi:hypothetical protein